ncbi:flagellar filament capping protein FliD [Rhodovibrionaceae bacterium A322]
MSDLNFNTVTGDDGSIRFSGIGSGIDYNALVEATMLAKRIPVDSIQADIDENQAQIDALDELSTLMAALQESLRDLYGNITFGNNSDIFEAKSGFATASRTDSQAASDPAAIMGFTISNAAQVGSHDVEVLQIAKAHRISTSNATSLTDDLGLAFGGASGSISGSFDINGTTINVGAADSIQDLRDRINNANTGANATGVSASVVTVGTGKNILVLTNDNTGEDIVIDNEVGSVLSDLGISADGGTTFTNELQAAQKAQLHVDGLLDSSVWESAAVTSGADLLSSYGVSAGAHSFEVRDTSGILLGTVNYNDTDSITTLASSIDAIAGVSASVINDNGVQRLQISGDGGTELNLTNDTDSVLSSLSVAKTDLVVERSENTVDDLFEGITLSLFQAEPGTTIKLDVEQDLNGVKSAITNFVDAYNAVKVFANSQTAIDEDTGEASSDAGALFSSRALADVESQLSSLLGAGAEGASPEFTVLKQIGLDFVTDTALSDPTQLYTLSIDDQKLNDALLNNPDDVKRLFAMDFSSSDPRISLLSFSGDTSYSETGYTLNIGQIGAGQLDASEVLDSSTLLNDAANSFGATTSGSFDINGTSISYDVTTDSLDSLVDAINAAFPLGDVQARIVEDSDTSNDTLQIYGSSTHVVVDNDTGDLLASLGLTQTEDFIISANINGSPDGSDDGSVITDGRLLTATDQSGANGLQLLYDGTTTVSGVQLDYSIGFGTNMFFALDKMLAGGVGAVDAERNALEAKNITATDRMEFLNDRLDYQREILIERYVNMESTLATLNTTKDYITQITDAMFNSNN